MRRGRLALLGFLGLAVTLAYLLYPLSSARFRIVVDEAKLRARERYLAEAPRIDPSRARRNIVLILADDLGKTDITRYDGWVPTPRIDAMGREGATCAEGYITSPICSPSRAGSGTQGRPSGVGSPQHRKRKTRAA